MILMKDILFPVFCSMLTVSAYRFYLPSRRGIDKRVQLMVSVGEAKKVSLSRATLIANLISFVQNGGDLVEAFEDAAGHRFSTRQVTYDRVYAMICDRCLPEDGLAGQETIARALTAVCSLSAESGCRASDCLQAVATMQKRLSDLEEARIRAFSLPKATVKLLSILPFLTVILGQLMGAHPLAYLFKPGMGLVCLGAGSFFYCLGLLWMSSLLRGLSKSGGSG